MTTINECLDLLSRASTMLSEAGQMTDTPCCWFFMGNDGCPWLEWRSDFSALVERVQREQNDKGAT